MFDGIAKRYDLLNRLMSLGADRHWRRRTVESLETAPGQAWLDLATGTADLAIELAEAEREIHVVGLDPSAHMLEIAQQKIEDADLQKRIRLVLGSAEQLPFEDASFDGATMAFGIRNVPDRSAALREIRRVLRPAGRLAIVELSEPPNRGWGRLARFYVHVIVPRWGAWLSGKAEYRYLQRSIAAFPDAPTFERMLGEAGFDQVSSLSLSMGACHVFLARRPESGP